jgi:hypothetical protein
VNILTHREEVGTKGLAELRVYFAGILIDAIFDQIDVF